MRISPEEMVYYQEFPSYAEKIFRILQELTQSENMYVSHIGSSTLTILESFTNNDVPLEKNTKISLEDTYCRLVALGGRKPLLIEDTQTHPLTSHLELNKKYDIRSYIGAPIILKGGELFGTVCMVDTRPAQFNEKSLRQLGNMAALLGLVIELEYGRLHDQRTGVLNRSVLDQINERTNNAACFHLRVTNFSAVSEAVGSSAAEAALVEFSRRLQQFVEERDLFISPAPDEFLLYVAAVPESENLLEMTARLQEILRLPVKVRGRETTFSVSTGVSAASPDGMPTHELFHQASLALEESGKLGENQITMYEETFSEQITRERFLFQELPRAMDRRDFYLVFQPQFETDTMEFSGVEAFVRWEHPGLGDIPEETFFPIVEKAGKLYELERWVIAQVCRTLSSAQIEHNFRVSINLSGAHSPNVLIPYLREVLWNTKANPFLLVFEFAEPASAGELTKLGQLSEEIRRLGIQVAIDDFGSGPASLKVIQNVPMDVLKLSADFSARAVSEESSRIVLDQLRKLGKVFHFDLFAQGIESRNQLDTLKRAKINLMQGPYFSRPLRLEILKAHLEHDPGFSSAVEKRAGEQA
jgi:diguanylate cyclase (GGDEF)-like protein